MSGLAVVLIALAAATGSLCLWPMRWVAWMACGLFVLLCAVLVRLWWADLKDSTGGGVGDTHGED